MVRLAEPSRWSDAKDDELMETLDVASVASQVERHTENLVQVQRAMYLDAARDVRPTQPGMPRVSIFRVKEHMGHIETAMDEHLQVVWAGGGQTRDGGGKGGERAACWQAGEGEGGWCEGEGGDGRLWWRRRRRRKQGESEGREEGQEEEVTVDSRSVHCSERLDDMNCRISK